MPVDDAACLEVLNERKSPANGNEVGYTGDICEVGDVAWKKQHCALSCSEEEQTDLY